MNAKHANKSERLMYLNFICVHLRSFADNCLCFFKKCSPVFFLLSLSTTSIASPQQNDPELRQRLIQAINASNSFKDRFDAEVWLLDMSSRLKNRISDTKTRLNLLRKIHSEASRAGLHPELVLAVIDIESRFDRFAISRSGAQGLMQVMPFWLNEIGHPDDNLMDVSTNLRMGCTILKYYLDKEKGDLKRALARYNGSLGSNKYPNKILDVLHRVWYKS